MTINAGDIVRVTSQMLADGGNVLQNVYHYRAAAGFSESDATVMSTLAVVLDNAYNEVVSFMTNQTSLDRHLFQVSVDGGASFVDLGERAMAGSAPANAQDPCHTPMPLS